MRNEILHGYLIHHRKYRDRSHIVHLFTQEHGRVDEWRKNDVQCL